MNEVVPDRTEGVDGVLDALEQAVTGARSMPMSSSVIVNRAELLALVDQVRQALPEQLTQADEVIADADAARAQARDQADALLAAAVERAAGLVEQDALVVAAKERAARVLVEAQAEAADLRRDADDYCDRRLADFEIDLGKVLSQVQAGRAKLADRLTPPQ
jgi:regulator of protease activity HflC (stomatin/prohibitin superfamily)